MKTKLRKEKSISQHPELNHLYASVVSFAFFIQTHLHTFIQFLPDSEFQIPQFPCGFRKWIYILLLKFSSHSPDPVMTSAKSRTPLNSSNLLQCFYDQLFRPSAHIRHVELLPSLQTSEKSWAFCGHNSSCAPNSQFISEIRYSFHRGFPRIELNVPCQLYCYQFFLKPFLLPNQIILSKTSQGQEMV